ncbi:VOC family protein [Paragemmobacter straminiformis]|uniref:VOC family protein n=1 Tax=Paragemmobacter straminiformis TaxID=2045119 RepID=A0A842I2H1_9RHOB|nr:VOC family protein [Gemmobacter straminiformis]MBC2834006.1 VOC family protein [Gemmobacter straminiformis]
MFSHATLGTNAFGQALAFWRAVMAALGHRERFVDLSRPWAGWEPAGGGRPLFLLTAPHDGKAATAGNGAMLAFTCASRAQVRAAHAAGLQAGGRDEGAPALRPEYHPAYYGAYLRDPDGNKIGFACHDAE